MQGIYTYIPETNHVLREYMVAAILSLLFMVPTSPVPALALLYFYVSTFRSMCAVPNMAVFCSSLTSCFPGMLLTHFLNDFEICSSRSNYYWCHPCFYIIIIIVKIFWILRRLIGSFLDNYSLFILRLKVQSETETYACSY
jgi:hypothetical protein